VLSLRITASLRRSCLNRPGYTGDGKSNTGTAATDEMAWREVKASEVIQRAITRVRGRPQLRRTVLRCRALFCDIVSRAPRQRQYVLNDSNLELTSFYTALRDRLDEFLDCLAQIERKYLSLKMKEDRKKFYYAYREQYWDMPDGAVRTAATLYFLMKTSFNGIWQTCSASRGRYATPCGLLSESKVFDEAQLQTWSETLRSVVLSNCSFEQVRVPPGSLVYCDPPYRGGFAGYGTSFTDPDQIRLIEWCDSIARQGSHVFLANRELGDAFFDEHLPDYCVVSRFDVKYTAGRKRKTKGGFEAKRASELLIDFAVNRA
jgi:DNA adenine methylase